MFPTNVDHWQVQAEVLRPFRVKIQKLLVQLLQQLAAITDVFSLRMQLLAACNKCLQCLQVPDMENCEVKLPMCVHTHDEDDIALLSFKRYVYVECSSVYVDCICFL